MDKLAWLYNPDSKPSEELSKHDQEMIQLGWDAHRTLEPQSDPLEDNNIPFTPKSRVVEYITADKCQARIEALIEEIDRELKLYVSLSVQEPKTYIKIPLNEWEIVKGKLKATHCKGEEHNGQTSSQ